MQSVLDRSSKIQSKSTILVGVEGGSLVLRGIVKNDHERRLAEAIARLTPGVRDLRNELAVRTEAIAAEANP
ncbi:MAG: BON domain-containing protein [Gemmataceae bacterium]